jgi:hypothetical protein
MLHDPIIKNSISALPVTGTGKASPKFRKISDPSHSKDILIYQIQ